MNDARIRHLSVTQKKKDRNGLHPADSQEQKQHPMLATLFRSSARTAGRAMTSSSSVGGPATHSGSPGSVGVPSPPQPKPGHASPPHFPGFKNAPGQPTQWTPKEQWVALGVIAAGVAGGGLWWFGKRSPHESAEGPASSSWERGPA